MPELPFNRINAIRSGQEFKHYRLLEQIGEGGQGCVWSALDSEHNRVVAIKFSETPEATDKISPEDIHIERQIGKLMRLRHPYILPMVDYGTSNVLRYIVSPYIPGGALDDLIDAGPVPVHKAIVYAAKIAAALDYLHEKDILHRDLKPSNVLLDLHQNIYLSDFGLARVISNSTQVMHTGRGTPFYAPPEQHTMSEAMHQSDVFSFGVMVYELLTGQLPWRAEKVLGIQQLQTKEEIPDPREIVPDLPAGLVDVFRHVTAALPAARPATAGQAMQAFYKVFRAQPVETASPDDWQEDTVKNLNALEIYQSSLQRWIAPGNTVPLTLTSFAIINSSQQSEQALENSPQFMLTSAISYGYMHEEWWQRTASMQDRLAVAEGLLQEDEEDVRRRITRLLAQDQEIRSQKFSSETPFIKSTLKGIGMTQDVEIRHTLLALLRETLPASKKWQPTAFSEQEDALVAYQALEDSPTGDEAAQLIGHLRAEQALQTVFKAAAPNRRLPALLAALQSAGTLPASIPTYPRFETLAEWILTEAFAYPNRLALLALSSLLGASLGFGIFTYSVYRLNIFLDTARFLTAVQHGLFIGTGFALTVPLVRIITERFPQVPAWQRVVSASLLGSLPLTSVILLYHTLLLERYEILQISNLGKLAPLLAGCAIIVLGFSLAGLLRARFVKILISAAAIILALFGSWWAHTNLGLRPFPMLYYEYTWPAGQVLMLIIVIAASTAIGACLPRLSPSSGQPAGLPAGLPNLPLSSSQ
jgi:serine/threonine protein kinase